RPLQGCGLGLQQPDAGLLGVDLALDGGDPGPFAAGHRLCQVDAQDQHREQAQGHEIDQPEAADPAIEPVHAAALHAAASVRTAALSFAERDRGFAASSASDGPHGPLNSRLKLGAAAVFTGGAWRDPAGVRPARTARKVFTILSSSEWNVTTQSRPPVFSARSAASSPASNSESSSFTAMRIAWNERVAGWTLAPRRPPRVFSMNSASSSVRVKGCSSRRLAIARAMRRLSRSSP